MRRIAAVTAAVAITAATALISAPAAHAAGLSCTVGGAAELPRDVPVAFDRSCESNVPASYRQFARITVHAGALITLDFNSTGASTWSIDDPATTDFTADGPNILCGGNWVQAMAERLCTATRTGSWLLNLGGHFMMFDPGTVTVHVADAPAVAGQVTGSCQISGAPLIPARVRQYSDALGCAVSKAEFWRLRLYTGDSLVLRGDLLAQGDPTGFSSVNVLDRAVTDYTLTQATPRCGSFVRGPTLISCGVIAATGLYTVAASSSVSLSATVVHRVVNTTTKAATVRLRRTYLVRDKLTSPAGVPVATCALQVKGRTWKTIRTVKSAAGVCAMTAAFTTRGYKTLRVIEKGATGWAAHTLPAFRVRVV